MGYACPKAVLITAGGGRKRGAVEDSSKLCLIFPTAHFSQVSGGCLPCSRGCSARMCGWLQWMEAGRGETLLVCIHVCVFTHTLTYLCVYIKSVGLDLCVCLCECMYNFNILALVSLPYWVF